MTSFRISGSSIELDPEWIAKMTPMLKGQPVGLYARISGRKSLDGSSLDSQIAVNRRFAECCGAHILAEKREVITGVFITSRSEFNALLQLGEKGELKFIIVDVRDRLGRGDAISVLEFLTHQAGAEIIYATQPADLDTYEGVALDATETLVSRIERLNIQRRLDRGRREWSSAGRIFTGRFFPYGYRLKIARDDKGRLIERTFVIYEPEAEIVRQIYRWFVYEDITTYAIAIRLQKAGVPVPVGHRPNRKSTSDQWYSSTVERILRNETYAGTWHYAKCKVKKYESGSKVRLQVRAHPAEHRIAIAVEPVVSRGFWQAAQEGLKRHARGGRPSGNEYLLSGLMRCIKSNANMHGQTTKRMGKPYGYYVCPHRSPHLRLDLSTRCGVPRLHQHRIENWVWSTLMAFAADPEPIRVQLAYSHEQAESEQQLGRQAVIGLQQEIVRLKRQKGELLDLYLNRERSHVPLTREEYEIKAHQLGQQLDLLESRLQEMQHHLQTEAASPDQIDAALKLLQVVRTASERATFRQKRAILSILEIQVLYDGERIEMTGAIPSQSIFLESLQDQSDTDESSSRPLQSELSTGFPEAEEDSSIFEDRKHNKDCMPG